jgi:glycine oxidase
LVTEGHYVIPRRDGYVLAGSTLEYVGYDKTTTEGAYRELHRAALTMVPALTAYSVEQQWAGLRPGSSQGIPLIGPYPNVEGLYIIAGHFRNGIAMGPASARLLADLILQRLPIIDPEPYRPLAQGIR